MTWVIYIALFGAIIYFLMIRPGRKRSEDQKQMMNAMKPGARVMLTSGVFGTIQAIGDQQAVVELAPGMGVTVVKAAIARVVPDSEEEFEYTDDVPVIEGEAEATAVEPAETVNEASDEAAAAVEDVADKKAPKGTKKN